MPFSGTVFEESPLLGRSEITYRDGLEEGPARDWYPSGVLKAEAQFVEGTLHGMAREYRPDGVLAEESTYEYGVRIFHRVLAPDGSVVETEELEDGCFEARLVARRRSELGWPR
ncbi:toxin-antitoxin system YwqK family antitoxin [Agromyces sp. NPDC004153]